MNELVSAIIPTTDKEMPITHAAYWCLQNSTYKNIEIILVNEQKERSEQRNSGIFKAKGKYILLLDSDQYVSSLLIEECVDLMDKGYDAVYIPEIIVTGGWFGRLRNWERQFYIGTPVDVVRFVRKSVCPMFDTDLKGPEDSDWDRRVVGKKTVSRNVLYHRDDVTILSFFSKKAYYSKSNTRYYEKWPKDKILQFHYRCFQIFMEDGKWKQFLARPLSVFAVMVLIFVRGVIYMLYRRNPCEKKS